MGIRSGLVDRAPASARRSPFHALVAANSISLNGNALAQLAIPWFVLETTGSAVHTGATAFVSLIPLSLGSFFGGVIVDRLGHKRASIIADLASMAAVALIPLLHTLSLLNFWLLLILVFLGALLDTPGTMARAALLPDLADLGRIRRERANAIHEVVESGAQLIGPLLAGLLIAMVGAQTVLWLNAATFAISAMLVGALIPDHSRPPATARAGRYSVELVLGLRFVLRDPVLRSIFGSAALLNVLLSPLFAVVLPFYIRETSNNAANLGYLLGSFGGGAVVGAVVFGAIGHRLHRRVTFVVGVFAIGAAVAILALMPALPLMIGAMLLGGIVSGPNGPLVSTVLQERTPPELRGRVFGTTTAVGFVAAPLGALGAGYLLQFAGVQSTIAGIAAIVLGVAVLLGLDAGLREMDAGAAARG